MLERALACASGGPEPQQSAKIARLYLFISFLLLEAFMTTSSTADASIDQIKNKIQQRQARVGIIGLGYVGLPLALLYSEQKFRVTGFDIDPRKVETLAKGGSYIYRIAPEEIQAAQKNGFTATSDYSQLTAMDAIIICVPTPLNE